MRAVTELLLSLQRAAQGLGSPTRLTPSMHAGEESLLPNVAITGLGCKVPGGRHNAEGPGQASAWEQWSSRIESQQLPPSPLICPRAFGANTA